MQNITRQYVNNEIARCYYLAINPECVSKSAYMARALRMWKASEDVFSARANHAQIERSKAILGRDMRDAPCNALKCDGDTWSLIWRALSRA